MYSQSLWFIILSTLLLKGNLFANTSSSKQLDFVPIPRSLKGYATWQTTKQPTIKIKISFLPNKRINIKAKLILKAKGAIEMKINNTPDFKKNRWIKYQEKIPWLLNLNDKISTVYAVFRYQNKENNRYEISHIVHDSFIVKQPNKKITATYSGYFDWHEFALHSSAMYQSDANQNPDYVKLQNFVEKKIKHISYDLILNIPINFNYTIKDYLYYNKNHRSFLKKKITTMKLERVFYPSENSIFLQKKFFFFEKKQESHKTLYQILLKNSYNAKKNPQIESFTKNEVLSLVIDTRGLNFKPSLFLSVLNNKNRLVLSPSFHTIETVPFVRYYRDIKHISFPKGSLLIRAYRVDNSRSEIIIRKFYGDIIRNNQKQIATISNGNFYVIVD